LIRIYYNDHAPPRFYAQYGEFEATINLNTLEVLEGAPAWPGFERGEGMGDDA